MEDLNNRVKQLQDIFNFKIIKMITTGINDSQKMKSIVRDN